MLDVLPTPHVLQCTGAHPPSVPQTGSAVFPLGPFDQLVAAHIPIAVIFVYDHAIDAVRLQRACELILDYYPHLTGRFVVDSANGSYSIRKLGTGAELVHAKCSETLDSYRTSEHAQDGRLTVLDLPGAGNDLLPPYSGDPADTGTQPLFAIQHTSFSCGSTALGIRLPHAVCDGAGYFMFVSHLAELYRGLKEHKTPQLEEKPDILPFLADFSEKARPKEKADALSYSPSMYHLDPPATGPASTAPSKVPQDSSSTPNLPAPQPQQEHSHVPKTEGRILRFSGKQLQNLKALATDPSDKSSWASTFEALAALFHQAVHRARVQQYPNDASALSPADFLCPLNYRNRITSLGNAYFGNAGVTPYTTFSSETLQNAPVYEITSSIHSMIRERAPSEQDITSTLRWIAAQPDRRLVKHGFRYGTGSFMISQWTRFAMYHISVLEDAKKPILVSPPFTSISLLDGLAYIVPTEAKGAIGGEDQDAVNVYLALLDETWTYVEQDKQLSALCDIQYAIRT